MTKPFYTLLSFLLFTTIIFAQQEDEGEHRILKNQFPTEAIAILNTNTHEAKRIRFYQEIDSSITFYTAKFKKDKLWYRAEFANDASLQTIALAVTPADIPSDVYAKMLDYFNSTFTNHRIRSIHQQYLVTTNETLKTTFRNAFQNLMLPSIRYEFLVIGKKDDTKLKYEVTFSAAGELINIRESLPLNYDHVLY